MAVSTLDFRISPKDGWTLVATNPSFLHIRPTNARKWRLALTAAGAPAATLQGLQFNQSMYQGRDDFRLDSALTAEVYIRVDEPSAPGDLEKAHFGVIRDQV
jgi:hypothetical protein